MHNSADAERARERLHGTVVEGRKIEVCMMFLSKDILLTPRSLTFSQCALSKVVVYHLICWYLVSTFNCVSRIVLLVSK